MSRDTVLDFIHSDLKVRTRSSSVHFFKSCAVASQVGAEVARSLLRQEKGCAVASQIGEGVVWSLLGRRRDCADGSFCPNASGHFDLCTIDGDCTALNLHCTQSALNLI